MTIELTKLLDQIPQGVESEVKATRDQTLRVLQDTLRAECRLVFRMPEKSGARKPGASVPVRITPGHPDVLKSISFSGEMETIALLSRYKKHLQLTRCGINRGKGLIELKEQLPYIPNLDPFILEINPDLESTLLWTEKLLELLEKEDPLKIIFAVNEDVLGAYEYELLIGSTDDREVNTACIYVYWAVIGLVARWLGCSVKDLTIVVLTHELAHAYTQLGADIEGRRWASVEFAKVKTDVKEGLAQYYTDRVLKRLDHRYPGAFSAFESLLPKQPCPYRVHEKWVGKFSPEVVRHAILEMRRWNGTELEDFNDRLIDARRKLKSGDGSEVPEILE